MATKIFISWSGNQSRQVAQMFNDWLPSVLQCVQPFFSPNIDKGVPWLSQIQTELKDTAVGIICVTKDNVEKPWLLFEAGALSKALSEANVCTTCFGIKPSDVPQPLGLFQTTVFEKDDIKKLLETINSKCGESQLAQGKLDTAFEVWWPILEKNIAAISQPSSTVAKSDVRSERELLEEILTIVRSNERETHPHTFYSTAGRTGVKFYSKGLLDPIAANDVRPWDLSLEKLSEKQDLDAVLDSIQRCLEEGYHPKEIGDVLTSKIFTASAIVALAEQMAKNSNRNSNSEIDPKRK